MMPKGKKFKIGFFTHAPHRVIVLCAIALFELTSTPIAYAEDLWKPQGRFTFKPYGPEQGLTSISVRSLAQDKTGYLWVGTESGLFRYNGSSFQRFNEGLPSQWIRVIYPAPDGKLWVGTLRGLASFAEPQFRTFGADAGLPEIEIYDILQDDSGRLWVGTHQGLFFEDKDGHFAPVPSFPENMLARTLCLDGDSLLVGAKQYLYRVPTDLSKPAVMETSVGDKRIEAIAKDHIGRLWLRNRDQLFMRPRSDAPFEDLSDWLPASAFYDAAIFIDQSGVIWLPHSDGVLRIEGDSRQSVGEKEGIPTPWVSRVIVDNEESLWLASPGLHRMLGRGIWTQFTKREGVTGGVVQSIHRDAANRLWFGTPQGLYQVTPSGFKLVPQSQGQVVYRIAEAPDGALWLGEAGTPPLLRRYLADDDSWFDLPAPTSTVLAMVFDNRGALWVGTRREGLYRITGNPGDFHIERVEVPGGGPDERIQDIASGADNHLWIGGSQGLGLLDNGQWSRFTSADGLRHDHIMAVTERTNGEIWVSYMESLGISRLSYENGTFRVLGHIDTRSGLLSDQVFIMREDVRGRLWVGTGNGVHLIDSNNRIQHFGTFDGLPGNDCSISDMLAERNGDFWVGTTNGMAHFRADRYHGPSRPPKVVLVNAKLGSRNLGSNPSQGLSFRHNESTLEFRFSALNFSNESVVHYQVRLVGLENSWRDTDVRQARYAALPAGKYRFEVRAEIGHDEWGEPAGYSFRVLPPWWSHWGFRLVLGLLVIGIVAFVVRMRERLLQRRNRELELKVRERTADLKKARDALWGEMQIAKKIQTELVPTHPTADGFEIAVYMEPADEVGGDYYDVIHAGGKDWFVIGDVSGHGVPAGLVMMMVQTAIHTALNINHEMTPSDVLTATNRVIYENIQNLGEDKYMSITVFACLEDGVFHYAGLHQDILIHRASSQDIETRETHGLWIGLLSEIGDLISDRSLVLEPGDTALLFTDGIVEARTSNGNSEMFSFERLKEAFSQLAKLSPADIRAGLISEIEPFIRDDDVTFMVIRRKTSAT